MVTCLAKTGSHSSHQVRMVSHVHLGRRRCGKGPSSHVSSPMTGQCPKIELFLLVSLFAWTNLFSIFKGRNWSVLEKHPPLSFDCALLPGKCLLKIRHQTKWKFKKTALMEKANPTTAR
ncbi:hypothetical protein T10_4693 [Trichinella papuae]|uniref:Uncharacterized protein n=1 Tax=Trichinella papuae TaxID=268474 RepID=A0A0V1MHA8_9BILA|nr:hypothetical protein T10_11540 [Trichinella papuae]KRZ71180.1 hypothetical protein T10_4693 [Trichinella papuae]